MRKIIIDCFEITIPDGSGFGCNHLTYTNSVILADEIVRRRQPTHNGYAGNVYPFKKEFLIIESMEELEDLRIEKIRSKALSKLNEEEKRVLGL